MNQTLETSTDVVTLPTSWNVTSDTSDEKLRSRNLYSGAIGLVLNIGTILLLSLNRKIKLSLRVTIVGLLLNNVILTIDVILLGVPRLALVSSSPACWPTVFILSGTLTVSYLTATLLTVHNYVAVFYPFSCSEIVSPVRSLIGVCVCWVGGYVICLAYLGTHLEPGLPCVVLVVISRLGLLIGCCICALLSVVITVLNIRILHRIKNRRKIVNFELGELHGVNVNKTSSIETEVRSDAGSTTTRIKGIEKTEVTSVRDTEITNLEGISQTSKDLNVFIVLPDSNKTEQNRFRSSCVSEVKRNSTKTFFSSKTNFNRNENMAKINKTSESLSKSNRFAACSSRSVSGQVLQLRTFSRRRDIVSFTLVIMTFWSCLLTFPMLVQMVYGAVLVEDRLKFTTSSLGLFISSLMSAHALSNPLLFAWRFGGWRTLWGKLKTWCRC